MESIEAFEIYPEKKNDEATENEAAEVRGENAEEAKEKLLRVCKTVTEMLRDRDFIVEQFNKEDFIAQHFPDGYNTNDCVTIVGSSQKKIQVRVYQKHIDMKDLTADADKILAKQMSGTSSDGLEMTEYLDPIFVVPDIKKVALKSLTQKKIQCFKFEELLVNITHHMLVPKFDVLSESEKKKLLECYKLKSNQLPKMLESDPISKYYGLKKGDVVKITRKSVTAGSINDNAGLVTNAEVYEAIKRNNEELKGIKRQASAQERDESTFLKAVEGYIKHYTNPAILNDRKKSEDYAKYLLTEGLSGIEIVQFSNFQPLEIVDVHIVVEECQTRLPDDKPAEIIEHLKEIITTN